MIDAAIRCWQTGFVARAIDDFYRTQAVRDTSGENHTGFLRYEDMAEWRLETEAPPTGSGQSEWQREEVAAIRLLAMLAKPFVLQIASR